MSFTFPFFDFVSVHSSTTGVRSRLQIAPTSSAPVNSPPSDTRETSYQCYARRSSPTTELAQFHQFASVKRLTMQCSSHSPCSIVQPDSIRYLDENYPTFTSRSFSNFTAPNRGAHSPEHTSQSLSRQVSFWYFLDIFLVFLEETVKQTASSDLFFFANVALVPPRRAFSRQRNTSLFFQCQLFLHYYDRRNTPIAEKLCQVILVSSGFRNT